MSQTSIHDLYDLARKDLYTFVRRPFPQRAATTPGPGEPVRTTEVLAALPHVLSAATYTVKTHHTYASPTSNQPIHQIKQALATMQDRLDKEVPTNSTHQPAPQLLSTCTHLKAASDIIRTTMPYTAETSGNERGHAIDTSLSHAGDILYTAIGSMHDHLRTAPKSQASTALLTDLQAVLNATAQLRDLPLGHHQITELTTATPGAGIAHPLRAWLTQTAPVLGTTPENLTGANIHRDYQARTREPETAQHDSRGSSFMLRGTAMMSMVINRASMHIIKAAATHGHLPPQRAAQTLERMNAAGQAWTDVARHWDHTVKVAGADLTHGLPHIQPALDAAQALNHQLRPLAHGDPASLRAALSTPAALRRTLATAQQLDATLNRLAFAHLRLTDGLANAGHLLGHVRAQGERPNNAPATNLPLKWVPLGPNEPSARAITTAAHKLGEAAQESAEATMQLRSETPSARRGPTQTPSHQLAHPRGHTPSDRHPGADQPATGRLTAIGASTLWGTTESEAVQAGP